MLNQPRCHRRINCGSISAICNENFTVAILQVGTRTLSTDRSSSCRIAPGSLSGTNSNQAKHLNLAHDNPHRTNILGPKHFIVEEENEALLAKELEEAKIQSAHNSHSSMHSSQPHIFHLPPNEYSKVSTALALGRSHDVHACCCARSCQMIASPYIPNRYRPYRPSHPRQIES